DLTEAYEAAPELAFPVRAWAELSGCLGGYGPPPAKLMERADAPPSVRGAIGYRRGVVARQVGAGFWVRLPGTLMEREDEDGVWAGDLDRSLSVAGIHVDDEPAAEALLAEAPTPEGECLRFGISGLETRAGLRQSGDERVVTA